MTLTQQQRVALTVAAICLVLQSSWLASCIASSNPAS
jgi:hypothetical protein